jgi:glucan 1,3-beta-glucosidase
MSNSSARTTSNTGEKTWIRGVNIGGWQVLERYITPYFFALTKCHLEGDFRFYQSQIDAPPIDDPLYKPLTLDDLKGDCPPIDSPVDEWTLTGAFKNKEVAKKYLEIHYDNFVKREDIALLKNNGVTHVRVPLGHWIRGDIANDEPYVDGGWPYFQRLVEWCREEGIEIWPDLHTAPGSQNGFDNSGRLGQKMTCSGWDGGVSTWEPGSDFPPNVERTLRIIDEITAAITNDNLNDVVTGFGILNEPFSDCNMDILRNFYNRAFAIVRKNLGNSTNVYIGDMFDSGRWNDGFWAGPEYKGTFLDSHIYQSFEARTRHLSPRQHIALVCQRDHNDVVGCCYENGHPTEGIGRIFSEWSASFDQSVGDQVPLLMKGIIENGVAEKIDRQLSPERKRFLRSFVEAQMVSYEARNVNESSGWFFWNFKVEGGMFAEWDFLRGLREGWIPLLPEPNIPSEQAFGSCYDIIFKTDDDWKIVDEIPDPSDHTISEQGSAFDDDIVLSHGKNLRKNSQGQWVVKRQVSYNHNLFWFLAVVVSLAIYWIKRRRSPKGYISINDAFELQKELRHVDTAIGSLTSED